MGQFIATFVSWEKQAFQPEEDGDGGGKKCKGRIGV